MPSLADVRNSNALYAPQERPVLVVFGGTSGVGAGILRVFARHTQGRIHIVIIGRSQSAADAIIASLPSHPESKYEFLPLDGTRVKNVRVLAAGLRERLGKINYLVLSQGGIQVHGEQTEEGFDSRVALMMHGRARAAIDLAPLLQNAASKGEDARVMFVANAGRGGPIDLSDLSLKGTTMLRMLPTFSTYCDIYTLELAERIPGVSVTHVFPGGVKSQVGRALPWYLYWIFSLLEFLFFIPADDCGEWMMSVLIDPETKTGAWFRRDHGQKIAPSKYADSHAREVAWAYFEEKTGSL